MKIGVITDCFKKNTKESIALAGSLGFDGVQIYATTGEFSPEVLTKADIEEYKKLLSENKLAVSALCGDMGGHGFEIAKDNPERIEKTKKIIDLACELGSHVVTTHIGVIPADSKCEKYKDMLSALTECGNYAKTKGVTLAIETGPEAAPTLAGFVNSAGDGVGVNLDPANFVMVTGQDPAEAVRLLGKKIVHTHLKDGKQLKVSDPVEIYRCFAEGGIDALNVADYFIETPIGEGDVDFAAYLKALREVGFNGFLTIERETGADPSADIAKAAAYIREGFAGYLD
jgi:sugar phosphate isomerase/epimerase